MSATAPTSAPDYGPAGEQRLRDFVENLTGGRITRMERQVRWRPAWFVDADTADGVLHLHLRGDREGDVAIFPELKREADVMEILDAQGVPVPHIYGYCPEPPAIIMETLPGSRNMAEAASDAERSVIAREYMAAVAAMHALPVEPFVAMGVHLPQGAEDIALVGLRAYMPLYERTRSKPEPMLDFVIGWLRRNVPTHRTKASFIQFDSGQFLFKDGHLTGLYDFEFSMIGDPMVDIATMRMRETIEPLGDDLRLLCRHYEQCAGEPIDHKVVDFHTLLFATLGTMQFAGTVGAGQPGDPHSVYLEFDLALRQVMLLALGGLMGAEIVPEAPMIARTGDNAALIAKISDAVSGLDAASDFAASGKDMVQQLLEWLGRSDEMGAEMRARDIADVTALLGRGFADWNAAEAALAAFVSAAGPEQDTALFRLFAAIEGRRMLVFGPTRIGHSASHVEMTPTH
jgi:aminoglycoside phosphotransferase (APT) family kinase protein